jgi:hypothetical protein
MVRRGGIGKCAVISTGIGMYAGATNSAAAVDVGNRNA